MTGDTGHVFIVADLPEVLDESHMAIPAYDSSDILHYDDSRDLGNSANHRGRNGYDSLPNRRRRPSVRVQIRSGR